MLTSAGEASFSRIAERGSASPLAANAQPVASAYLISNIVSASGREMRGADEDPVHNRHRQAAQIGTLQQRILTSERARRPKNWADASEKIYDLVKTY